MFSASERFRFTTDGEEGAGGSEGGVSAPLTVAMVMDGAVGDAVVMRSRCATRSGPSARRGQACTFTNPAKQPRMGG